jgi:hypothetical protein
MRYIINPTIEILNENEFNKTNIKKYNDQLNNIPTICSELDSLNTKKSEKPIEIIIRAELPNENYTQTYNLSCIKENLKTLERFLKKNN